jgi:predicted cation transporter
LDIINLVDILTITIAVLILFILIFYFYFRQKIKKLAQTRKGVEVIAFTLKSQEERINALEQMIGG